MKFAILITLSISTFMLSPLYGQSFALDDDNEENDFSWEDEDIEELEKEWANLYGVKYWYCELVNDATVNDLNQGRLFSKLENSKDLEHYLEEFGTPMKDESGNAYKYLLAFKEERLTEDEKKHRNSPTEYLFSMISRFPNMVVAFHTNKNGLPEEISFDYQYCPRNWLGNIKYHTDNWTFSPEQKNLTESPTMQVWDLKIKRDVQSSLSLKDTLNFKLLCTKFNKTKEGSEQLDKLPATCRK